ncbi:Hsp20/alpha crystallin family protein [Marinobacterium arenosum]|uniref:Hsp20/alpha crystallin family protein n=1 Tax=Marinobacterium arenosum TaxID=2862496 RepID=UPI001C958275|nr:Hsp20/alpha crystallin family protein [Marinobacterium arenosum]MBY4676088.1 Hsp20/alpha crystallin family protein [Marinobacterium arenosum]
MKLSELTPWNWFKKEGAQGASMMPAEYYGGDPFKRMARLHQEVDRFFDEMMHELGAPARMEATPMTGEGGFMIQPRVDIKELAERFEIAVEVPGVEEKDLHIDLSGDTLIIRGEKTRETSEEKGDYHRRECAWGGFKRMLSLPDSVDKTQIAATFKNGLLTVSLPKLAQAKTESKHIEIKH